MFRKAVNVSASKTCKWSKRLMRGGMLQGVFVFSPVDNGWGKAAQLVQMSWMINSAANERRFESRCKVVNIKSKNELCIKRRCCSLPYVPQFLPFCKYWLSVNYLDEASLGSDQALFNPTRPIWEKDPFHSTYLAACRLAIMGMLNELWSNSQLNALKGMPRSPAWKASGVKCLFFKSAANVGCFQVLLLLCCLPLAVRPSSPSHVEEGTG